MACFLKKNRIHYYKDWKAKKVLLKSKPYSDSKKYTGVLEAAEADSKLRQLEHKYLCRNTYKRFFSIIFCEKPVMLKVKIKRVKTPQEIQNPNVAQTNMDITKSKSLMDKYQTQTGPMRKKLVDLHTVLFFK